MSSFNCEHCGTEILDSDSGYTTACKHYPLDIKALQKDKARMDWLADRNNPIGNVQLPTQIVIDNSLGGLRDMIDAAMELSE